MNSRLALVVLVNVCAAELLLTQSSSATEVFIPDKFKGVILYAEGPVNYSNTGKTGVYRLTINQKTGLVDEVGILKAVNHFVDPVAVVAFMKWKFKPGTLKRLDVPVRWDRQATVLLKNAGSE